MARPVARPLLAALVAAAVAVAAVATSAAGPQAASAQEMMSGGGPRAVVHDPQYFRDRVLPVLAQHCLGCHDEGDPANETRNRLAPPGADGVFDAKAVQRNFESVRTLMDAREPERSPLLLKLLPTSRGGVDHDGGKADDTGFPRDLTDPKGPLLAWAFGATPADAPPLAAWAPVPRQVPVGEEVRLDATLSADPDGRPVTVRWEVADAPQGARAKPEDPRAKTTRIVPDREGPWILRLRVDDGRLGGWPALVRFAAVRRAAQPTESDRAPRSAVPIDAEARRTTRILYLDLWGRAPTEEEMEGSARRPWAERVDLLLDTEETWRNWLEDECFHFLLIDQFRPVSDRVAAIPAGMREGRTTFREAHHTIALSSEFNARNPGNDTFCTVVLEQFLAIEVQKSAKLLEAAKLAYDGKPQRIFDLPVRNQSDVVQAVLAQRAYADVFVQRMERRFLGRDLPRAEHDAAVSILHAQPAQFRLILREWLLSDGYAGPARPRRRKSDFQFIRSLFVDLLGRPPAYEEFRNMRNALQALSDPTPLRGVLAKVLVDSSATIPPPEAAATDERYPGDRFRPQIVDLFRRLLGRDPTAAELQAFAQVLAEPGATWRTAAMGILSSLQYQEY